MNVKNWTFREVTKFLKQHGFVYHKTRGSHFQYKKKTQQRKFLVVVPSHSAKSIPIGTMRSIIQQSGIPKEKWKQ